VAGQRAQLAGQRLKDHPERVRGSRDARS